MIDLVRLHHVSFAIQDLEACKRFFGGVLGLQEIERPGFKFSGAWYALGDRQLHLIQQDAGRPKSDRLTRADHMALEVRDIGSVKKILAESNIDYTEGSNTHLGMDQVFCQDPDGHVIEFVYYRGT